MPLVLKRIPGQSVTLVDSRTGEVVGEVKLDREHGDCRFVVEAPDYIKVHRTEKLPVNTG